MYGAGVDIIVVNYHTSNDLLHFLRSLDKHSPTIPFTLTVVNVDPLAEDVEVLQQSKAQFRYISHNENIGYGRAVNNASFGGQREILAIFNADTRLTDNLVTGCCDALLSDNDWGVLGPRQVDDGGRITHGGIFEIERGFHHRNSEEYADIRDDARNVSGAAYFVKREVWDELTSCDIFRDKYPDAEGAFLPTPHYWEEHWASSHAISHGYKVVFYGALTMVHRWHKASPRGGWADRQIPTSRRMYQEMCEAHGI